MKIAIFIYIASILSVLSQVLPLPLISSKKISSSSSTLNTSLIAYWKLDEASGMRVDSEPTGTAQDLTDNNTVNQTNGIISSAALFIAANAESLTRSSSSDLQTGDIALSFSVWVLLNTTNGYRGIIAKRDSASSAEYGLDWDPTVGKFRFYVNTNNTSGGYAVLSATNGPTAQTNTWYHLVAYHDPTANQLGIIINNGTPTTMVHGTGVASAANTFRIGVEQGVGAAAYMDGRIDELGFWKKVLSASEITELYNSGSGKTCCPF